MSAAGIGPVGDVVITGLGMVTPVGLDMVHSCSSIRAGLTRFNSYDDHFCFSSEHGEREPEPVVCARVPLPMDGPERMPILLHAAAQDLVRNTVSRSDMFVYARTFVGLPPALRTGAVRDFLGVEQAREALQRIGPGSNPDDMNFFFSGGVAFLDALESACRAIKNGQCETGIIVCADSYHDPYTLAWLDGKMRLKSQRNRDGFIPGEAGVAVGVESAASARANGSTILARIDSLGRSIEPRSLKSGEPSTAVGLTQAITQAVGPELTEIAWVACDLNGESYRAQEWGNAQVRLTGAFRHLKHVWHPADCVGDVGAASAGLLTVIAARAMQRGYAPADRCLIWSAADDGQRSAMIISKVEAAQQ